MIYKFLDLFPADADISRHTTYICIVVVNRENNTQHNTKKNKARNINNNQNNQNNTRNNIIRYKYSNA